MTEAAKHTPTIWRETTYRNLISGEENQARACTFPHCSCEQHCDDPLILSRSDLPRDMGDEMQAQGLI